jgi:hypothetical protein
MQPLTLTEAVDLLQRWQDGHPTRHVQFQPNTALGGYDAVALSREPHLAFPPDGRAVVWTFHATTQEEAMLLLAREIRTQLALDFDGYIERDNEEDPLPVPAPVAPPQIITFAYVATGQPIARFVLPEGHYLHAMQAQALAFQLLQMTGLPIEISFS